MSDHPNISSQVASQPAAPEILPSNRGGVESRRSGLANSTNVPQQGYSSIVAWLWLTGSLVILVLAAILSVGPARRVYLPGITVPMPETCTMYVRLGLDCPGCGLTRSFIHFADGRLLEGMSLNPAGIVIFLFVAAQVPAALIRFALGRNSRFAIAWCRCNEIALVVLPSLTLFQWIVRMVLGDYT